MAEALLGKLQCQIIKLEKEVNKFKDQAAIAKEEAQSKKAQYDYLQKSVEKAINKAVEEAITKLNKEHEKEVKALNQRIFELETRLNINSTNSSLPSSKNPIYQSKICNSRKPTDKSIGGQKGHPKSKLEKFKDDEVTNIAPHVKIACPHCLGMNLTETGVSERDELDYEIKVIKRRHKFYEYKCDDCGKTVKSEIPSNLHAECNYGANVKTLCATLTNYGFVSYNRTRKIVCGLTNGEINPSEGFITKLQKQASSRLKDFIFDVKEELKKSNRLQWDDTVVAIAEKDKACMRVYTGKSFVLYKAHMAKDTGGMNEDGILQNLPSTCTVIHDHLLHNYCDEYKYQNAECNAHITRKLEGITQNTEHTWSDKMKKLLESTLDERYKCIEKKITSFTKEYIDRFDEKYDIIIKEGLLEYKEFKHKYEFEKEENLLEFMRDYKEAITAWVRDFTIPFSNNLCETLLRMLKSKLKISFRFQSLAYAEYFADIVSYTETCSNFGVNKVEALRRLFDDDPYTVQELLDLEEETSKSKNNQE